LRLRKYEPVADVVITAVKTNLFREAGDLLREPEPFPERAS